MKNYINLFLSAIKPITLFLPCSAVLLGCGFSAFYGIVDGTLFSSLLMLSFLTQITLNLASDYQQAFLTYTAKTTNPDVMQKKMLVRMAMLKLILGCYIISTLSLLILTAFTVPGSMIAYVMVALFSFGLLGVIRFKTRQPASSIDQLSIISLLLTFSISGVLPVLLSYYLHTVHLSLDIVLVSIGFAMSTLLPYLSEHIIKVIKLHAPIKSDLMPTALSSVLNLQKAIFALIIGFVLILIGVNWLPILVCFSYLAMPSLFATNLTLQHFPELDIAQSQKTKVTISCFAFWVLFVVGLMIK